MTRDMMPAAFGGVMFRLESISGGAGRDVAIQSPSRGDRHVLQDRGLRMRSTRCEIFFVNEPGLEPAEKRYRAFLDLANKSAPEIFTHPYDGSYLARVTEVEYSAGADDAAISVSCTFLQDGESRTVFYPGFGAAPTAGVEEVAVTVAATEEQLDDAGLVSEVPQSTLDTVTAWTQAETPDSRAVYLEVASLSGRISDEINRLELVSDLDRWLVYREFITLQSQILRAAESVTSESENVYDVVVPTAMPVRLLCAQIYGAAASEDKSRQVTLLNRLRTPGLVPPGTLLKMPREGVL